MLSVPLATPPTPGAKTTNTSQCVPGAMTPFQLALARQKFWDSANGPVMVTLLTDTPTEPVLAMATFCARLVVPTATEPKDRLVGETETEAALDTVTVTAADVVTLPAASHATAVRVGAPLVAVVGAQGTEKGAVVSSAPRSAPSSLNCTPPTPTLSLALAGTVTAPATVVP